VTIASDASWSTSSPRLEWQATGGKIIPIGIEVEWDLQQVSDDDGPAGAISLEIAGVPVEKRLVDLPKIEETKVITHELKEASCAVEHLPDAAGRKYLAVTWQIDVQPSVEEFTQRLTDTRILDRPEMHGDVTAAGILAKHGWSEIPARIAVSRQSVPIETGL